MLLARRLFDGAEPLRRRIARLSELSGQCNIEEREYKVFGYKGKQVRDNIHSEDVAEFIVAFYQTPRDAARSTTLAVGKTNSCSILEAFAMMEEFTGKKQQIRLRGTKPGGRSHLLLQRSPKDESALSWLDHHAAAAGSVSRNRRFLEDQALSAARQRPRRLGDF